MTDDEISALLFVSQEPIRADLAVVFDASNELDLTRRVRRGVELYHAGYVPKLLLSGGAVLSELRPEAPRMVELARQYGVPDRDLLVEDRSGNTFENVQFSLALLKSRGLVETLARVILVSSSWHMRRVLLTSKRFFPPGVRFVCCPPQASCTRDNWTASEACRREVAGEALLLETYLETGAL